MTGEQDMSRVAMGVVTLVYEPDVVTRYMNVDVVYAL